MFTLCATRYETCHSFIITIYGVMNYSLFMSKFAFYAKVNVILKKYEFDFALEISFSI